jgi:hypothetical protein
MKIEIDGKISQNNDFERKNNNKFVYYIPQSCNFSVLRVSFLLKNKFQKTFIDF